MGTFRSLYSLIYSARNYAQIEPYTEKKHDNYRKSLINYKVDKIKAWNNKALVGDIDYSIDKVLQSHKTYAEYFTDLVESECGTDTAKCNAAFEYSEYYINLCKTQLQDTVKVVND